MLLRPTIELRSTEDVEDLLLGATMTCCRQVRAGQAPNLYASGVRYQREPIGRERWQTASETFQRGYGDCEDLALYRCGELWAAGETDARCVVIDVRPGLKHCVVKRANGEIEDPSKRLGMNGKG
jgi:hypothetical protein